MLTVAVDDGIRLHYREAGSGSALLFHPGFSSTLDMWNWLVRELAPTYRCITFDPRGHGASDKPDSEYTLDEMARDIAVLTERLGLRDVTLVGHSLGGAVTLTAVLNHNTNERFSRLALVGPAVPSFLQRDEEIGTPAEAFTEMHAHLANSWVATQLQIAEIFYHRADIATARWLAERSLAMPIHIAERYFAQLSGIDFRDRLADVTVPVLVLWGTHDQLIDPRWAEWLRSRNLPGWSVEMLQHSGHGAMVDEPVRIAELLRSFVPETAPDPSTASR
jgi:pimeloyl-ACP methyl ester carboxylesterase